MTDPVIRALREIVPVTRGELDLGGRMIRWVESGTGTPAVVLIAGRNDTALSWGPVLAALAGRVHAVAYDRAGLHAARHVVAAGSGHAVPLDRSALVAEAILGCVQ